MLLISFVITLPFSRGGEPDQSFQWTIDQWRPFTYKQPKDWPSSRGWTGLAFRIPRNTIYEVFDMDTIIHRIFFDTTKFDMGDPTSLYKAISHIRLKTNEDRSISGGTYAYKTTNNDINIPFRINQPDFIEFLIKNKVYACAIHKITSAYTSESLDILPDGKLNNYFKMNIYLPKDSQRNNLIKELMKKEYIYDVVSSRSGLDIMINMNIQPNKEPLNSYSAPTRRHDSHRSANGNTVTNHKLKHIIIKNSPSRDLQHFVPADCRLSIINDVV